MGVYEKMKALKVYKSNNRPCIANQDNLSLSEAKTIFNAWKKAEQTGTNFNRLFTQVT